MRYAAFIFAFFGLFEIQNAIAGRVITRPAYRSPQQSPGVNPKARVAMRPKSGSVRRPSSVRSSALEPRRTKRIFQSSLSVLAGAAASNTLGEPSAFIPSGSLQGQATLFGLIGVEAEGYYMPQYQQSVTDSFGTYQGTESQMGYSVGGKLQTYVGGDQMHFIPKIGGGYTATRFSLSNVDTAKNTTRNTSGPYVIAGGELEFGNQVAFQVDYLHVLSPKGTQSTTENPAAADLAIAGMGRFRMGATYRINPTMKVGAQYIYRTFNIDSPTGGQVQYLGMFQVEL